MPAIRAQLTHMGLYVRDLPAMTRFYTEVLGLSVADRGPGRVPGTEMVFLTADPECHHQVVLVSGRPETDVYNPINQISFTVRSLDELRAVRDRALALGASALRQTSHGNAWSVYFRDPEGNTLEAYLDTPFHVPQPWGRAGPGPSGCRDRGRDRGRLPRRPRLPPPRRVCARDGRSARRYEPLNTGVRRSAIARVPSRKSSV
jgi:catechol 2,3-dioxygenase